jgi:hypothetical protein
MAKRATFMEAALMALRTTGRPMTCKEMVEWAQARGELTAKGRTPANTLNALISRSIAQKPDTPFRKIGKGRVELMERRSRSAGSAFGSPKRGVKKRRRQ